jgi:hypothetical protein
MSIAVQDWDDLSAVPRRRDKQAPAEQEGAAPATGRRGVAPTGWDDLSTARRRRDRKAAAGQVENAPATEAQGVAPADWDDLSTARRRRDDKAAAEQPEDAPATEVRGVIAGDVDDDDSLDDYGENLRPVLSIAGGNLAVWALGHLTGMVELIGVSFFASVGLLLAAYILREWHRDRGALVCLVGALPLPITIFSLLTG